MTEAKRSAAHAGTVWLPDFCSGRSLLPVVLLGGLVALIAVLMPGDNAAGAWQRIGPISFFSIWMSLVCAACLCLLKQPLRRLGPAAGSAAALALVALVCAICGWLAAWFSGPLQIPIGSPTEFLLKLMALGVLVAAAALRYGYIHEQWKQQVQANARAELEALQARIRPHFLFNTLNAVAALIRPEPDKAESAVLDLSDLLRAAMKAGSELVPLEAELELVERYLAIEALRLGQRLKVRLERPPADLSARIKLPPLTLQPLVENAILHGIQPRPAGGLLELWTVATARALTVHLRNPLPEASPAPRSSGNGIAIDNVRARLQAALGPHAQLDCGAESQYFLCNVVLPFSQ